MKIKTSNKKATLGKLFYLYCILLLSFSLPANAKTYADPPVKITGIITDIKGEVIVGANVLEKGTMNGVITDTNGKFSIETEKQSVLQITYIGYIPQEIEVKDQQELKIILKEDTHNLEEVVVVGFGTQKKVNLTGAVSTINMEEIVGDRPVTNTSSALQGAIPGLQVTSKQGAPGVGVIELNVRGINSINGGEPLVLVDNMPMNINMIDPNDIETVNVLKDAAASAIYGARAAFGVILITTKQSSKGDKIRLNYSNNFSFSAPYNTPKVASPYHLVKGYKDMGAKSDPVMGANIDKWLSLLDEYKRNPSAYPDGYYIDELGTTYFLQEHDKIKDMMSKFGFQQSHNISMSGSGSKTTYRISLGTLTEDGILYSDKDYYRRYNFSTFLSSDITKWLTIQTDIKYTDTKNTWVSGGIRRGIFGRGITYPSYFPLEGKVINGTYYMAETPKNGIIQTVPTLQKDNTLRTIGRAIVTLLSGLTVTGEYSFMREGLHKNDYSKIVYYTDPVGMIQQSFKNSKYEIVKNSNTSHNLNLFANYNKDWGNHSFSLMGGYNQEDNYFEKNTVSKLDMINNELPSISQATGILAASDAYREFSTRSLFYRINYSYAGKYLIETNGRYDGSSKFPKSSRFGFFPSVSLGWRLSEESFMKWSDKYLSNLKLRFSLGEIGNQAIDPYAFIPGMEAYLSKWLVGGAQITSLKAPALISSDFTWERVRTYNYGIDIGLLEQKLDISFDYYTRNTMDMLAPGMELPSVLGASAPQENVADLQTKGWELTMNWRNRIGNVNYHIGFNLYDSKSKITKFNNEVGLIYGNNKSVINRVGKTIGEIWGYETDRFYTIDDFDEKGKIKEGIPIVEGVIPNPGDILYVDQNKDGIINKGKNTINDPGDLKIIGNDTRRFQYGITAGANYKGFDLSLFMQGVGKRDLWRNNDLVFPYVSTWATMFTHQLNYWTPENTNSFYPRLYEKAGGNTNANRNIQSKYLINGAYFRIKNITLSYTIPKVIYQKLKIEKIGIFFSGEDLWTYYKAPTGLDPEINPSSGGGGWNYPYMKKFSFGINISL